MTRAVEDSITGHVNLNMEFPALDGLHGPTPFVVGRARRPRPWFPRLPPRQRPARLLYGSSRPCLALDPSAVSRGFFHEATLCGRVELILTNLVKFVKNYFLTFIITFQAIKKPPNGGFPEKTKKPGSPG